LSDIDRGAVAMKFLQGKTISEVGAALHISSAAATKRINRALVRLRRILGRRGVAVPVLPLGHVLQHLPQYAAPPGLVDSTVSASSAAAATLPASIQAISKGATHMIIWNKAQLIAKLVAAVLLVGGIAGIGGLSLLHAQDHVAGGQGERRGSFRSVGGGSGGRPPFPDITPTTAPADPSSLTAKLKSGVQVELVGICEHPSDGMQWWRADGSLMPKAPYRSVNVMSQFGGDNIVERQVAVRLHVPPNAPKQTLDMRWSFAPRGAGGSSGGESAVGPSDAEGKPIEGLLARTVGITDDPNGGVLHADIATEPWKTVATAVMPEDHRLKWSQPTPYLLSLPEGDERQTRFSFSGPNPTDRSIRNRIIAIDQAGTEHQLYPTRMMSDPNGREGDFTVRLPLAQIKELWYQERSFDQWVEIRNVSLHAGKQMKPQIITSDDPPAQP
jgi:hypothetical protein